MDYLHAAYGPFEPQRDALGALKFSLNVALMDGRIDELAQLMEPGSRLSGLGGEPGWEIDRTDAAAQQFVARVDRDAYSLAHPEVRCARADLWAVLRPMLAAYAKDQPQDAERVERLMQQAATPA